MDARVPCDVEAFQRGTSKVMGGGLDVSAGQGEDRPVVDRVDVKIEKTARYLARQVAEDRGVPALADVDHTFEHERTVAALISGLSERVRAAAGRGCRGQAATPGDPATLTLGRPTPHTVVDVIRHRVLQAR